MISEDAVSRALRARKVVAQEQDMLRVTRGAGGQAQGFSSPVFTPKAKGELHWDFVRDPETNEIVSATSYRIEGSFAVKRDERGQFIGLKEEAER